MSSYVTTLVKVMHVTIESLPGTKVSFNVDAKSPKFKKGDSKEMVSLGDCKVEPDSKY
jgi:hypothetical protein